MRTGGKMAGWGDFVHGILFCPDSESLSSSVPTKRKDIKKRRQEGRRLSLLERKFLADDFEFGEEMLDFIGSIFEAVGTMHGVFTDRTGK